MKRFNSLAILNCHKEYLDKLSLIDFANDFAEGRSTRRDDFGMFKNSDLDL